MVPAFHRVLWSCAAAAPAFGLLILPHWLGLPRPGDAALLAATATAALLATLAIRASRREPRAGTGRNPARRDPARRDPAKRNPALLTRTARRRCVRDTPAPATIRTDLSALLTGFAARRAAARPGTPDTSADALCRVLLRVLQTWRADGATALDDSQLRALWLLWQLIAAPPSLAGTLAQNFRRPDTVLAIRDQILEIDARHQTALRHDAPHDETRTA